MKSSFKLSLLAVLTSSLMACGGSSSDSNDGQSLVDAESKAAFSLGVSDAPVDEAESVFIEIDSISLIDTAEGSENTTTIDTFTNEQDEVVQTIKVDLLSYQGTQQLKIIDESQGVELTPGEYELELNVVDAGSYVLLDNDATEHPIKVPSSRLRLGAFAVVETAVQVGDTPAYTVEFDLRKSLVQRGNANNNNGYIIKPNGVRVVSLYGGIEGTVSAGLTNLGQCTVYLYDETATEYGDLFDPEDPDFVAPADPITASIPLASTVVATDGSFAIGFIEQGSYQLALNCGTDVDDNIQYDGFAIPSSADGTTLDADVLTVEVTSQTTTTVSF
ncbi:DUF4382 domain-containing protein [Psychrosphaera ytuae]|uniref:DUF4382 domain-containing protein n=1 Tax=Psychrosphaera ytuae TaxID=2820710 RepID=A0A975DEA9_9GAMM|nr:DUF4382 domain-containing protein [Psychrosphaera ytuae]QTH65094.1 DUF4382 domain-containing protein [Psychrosphaera ytuae]